MTKVKDPYSWDAVANENTVRSDKEFETTEYESRFRSLRSLAQRRGIDWILLSNEDNARYFGGLASMLYHADQNEAAYIILPVSVTAEPVLVVPEFLEGVAHAKSWIGNIRCSTYCYGRPNRPSVPVLIETIRQLGIERGVVGAELSGHRMGITLSGFLHVQQELPGLRFVDAGDLVWEVRRTKSPQELKYLKTACDISQAGFQSGLEAVHPGMTERELAGIILSTFYREGADSHGFAIQSGAKGMQVRDGTVSDFPLQRGHFMKWDGGAWYRGYKCDFCRMVSLGEPTERQREGMDASVRGNTAAKVAVRAGVTIDEVCKAADRTIEGTGFNHYWNALGHGIGQGVHEEPMLWRGRQDELRANDFLAIEFNVVDPEHFEDGSFTFEDNFCVTHDGIEMFTGKIAPQLIVID